MSEFGHFIPVKHKVGDIVLVPKIGTLRIDFEGEEFYIAQDREILAVIKTTQDNE
jgi:co-chaperonin GroES (HSP10)